MTVSIDTGDVVATSPARLYDSTKWPELILLRRQFIKREITKDCRYLSRFVAEAAEMYKACGYASRDEMLAKGYEVDPQEMELAVAWLELNDPTEAVPLKTVLELARHGGDRKSQQFKNQVATGNLKKLGSNKAAYILARLKRDGRQDLLAKVEGEKLSARSAGIEAGFIRRTITVRVDNATTAIKCLLRYFSRDELRKALDDEKSGSTPVERKGSSD